MLRTFARMTALAAVAVLPLAACGDDDVTGPNTGRVSVFLTDAPGDFHAAVVTIARVELLGQGADAEGEGEAQGTVVLRDEEWTGDLLELQNEIAALVEGATIPAGRYHQIRLVIPEACIEVETETGTEVYSSSSGFDACGPSDGTLQMPSFGSSGLKINLPGGGIEIAGTEEAFLLDFHVSQSFGRQAGASNRWVLNPVIRAERFSAASSVNVTVALAEGVTLPAGISLEGFGVSLDGESAVQLGADGTASFGFVLPGEHTLTLIAPEGSELTLTTEPAIPHTFQVSADSQTDVTLTLTSVL